MNESLFLRQNPQRGFPGAYSGSTVGFGLWLDLEKVLGCEVDVVSSRGFKPRLASEVTRDAVSL